MQLDELYLRIYGDPVLRERAEEVHSFDDDLRALVERMFEVMYTEVGVGLAAPQVGSRARVMVLDVPLDDGGVFRDALVNPEILEAEGTQKGEEGCLSFPGIREDISRSGRIRVRANTLSGEPLDFEANGLFSRAIQHELDHLNGVLFIDRMSPIRRRLLAKKLKKLTADSRQRVS